jgi:hypothetical protein
MLTLNGERFASGRSKFLDNHPRFSESTSKVFVKVAFAGLDEAWIAQLDTGAAYSLLEHDVAMALGLFRLNGLRMRLSTRFGVIHGQLIRLPLTLVADQGDSLDLEGPFFISPDWRGGTFLGYTGLLDRLRIALDSPANLFYFGEEG